MTPTFLHSLYAFCRSTVLHFLAVAPLTRAEGLSSKMSGVICGQSPRHSAMGPLHKATPGWDWLEM